MTAVGRSWVAFSAVAAGILHIALALGRPVELASILFLVGLVEFAWGALVLSRAQLLAPQLALPLALAPAILWAVALFAGVAGLSFLPLATSTLLELIVAVLLARSLRRTSPPTEPGPRRRVIGIAIALIVVAGLTLPALTFTQSTTPASDIQPSPEHGHR